VSGCREVYHFAADMGGVGYLSTDQARSYAANSRMTLNVFEALSDGGTERAFARSERMCVSGRAPTGTLRLPC
jgi:nucleoside-diphosphate-sugar epimerase